MKITCSLEKIKNLDPSELKDLLDKGNITLLDVREIEEYIQGHIKGSIHIPLRELEYRLEEIDRNKPVVTYCRSGNRSLGASIILCSHGFKEVFNLNGGIINWKYEIEKGIPEEKEIRVKISDEMLETFRLALSFEKGSYNFYMRAMEKTGPELKGVLERLLKFEKSHLEKILQYYFYFTGEDPSKMKEYLDSIDPSYIEGKIEINRLILEFDQELKDEKEILEFALEKEIMAKELYLQLSTGILEPKIRALYNILANEERGHIEFISDTLKRL